MLEFQSYAVRVLERVGVVQVFAFRGERVDLYSSSRVSRCVSAMTPSSLRSKSRPPAIATSTGRLLVRIGDEFSSARQQKPSLNGPAAVTAAAYTHAVRPDAISSDARYVAPPLRAEHRRHRHDAARVLPAPERDLVEPDLVDFIDSKRGPVAEVGERREDHKADALDA